MKRTLSLFFTLVMVLSILTSVPITVSAASSGTCGTNLTWKLKDNGTLTISGEGWMTNFSSDTVAPWDNSTVKKVVVNTGVISIGSEAFMDCENLTSITIPDTITYIGDNAFFNTGYYNNSSNWKSNVLYINNHLISAKRYDESLSDYISAEGNCVIKDGTKTIATSAFQNCSKLTSITIADSVTHINEYAFRDCDNLASIIIPESVTDIGYFSFYSCDKLMSITLPDGVESIGEGAFWYTGFYDDENNWENDVIYINNHLIVAKYALDGSYKVKEGTKSIADAAFEDCDKLTAITIPDGVNVIGKFAFLSCGRLKSITLPDTLTRIGLGAFEDTAVYDDESNWEDGILYINNHLIKAKDYWEYRIMNCRIKKGTKTIADYAFDSGKIVKWMTYPVPRNVIKNKASLIVEHINPWCIYSLVIPKSVTNIGSSAFSGRELKYVFYEGTESQWKNINIKSYNSNLINSPIHYNTVDHTAGEWIVDEKATVTAPGSKHKECTVCGLNLETAQITQLKCSIPKLKSVANVSAGVKITWNNVSGADSYTVMRKTGNGKWTTIINGLTSTTYTDTTAKNGTTYKYTVKAQNEVGFSKYNTTGLSIKKLAVPTKITVANAKAGITVKWGKVTGATGYYVMRKTGKGSWEKIATVKGTAYTDKTAKSGVNYKYTIKAYYGKFVSAYNTMGVAVKRLVAPEIVSAVSNREGILLKWNKITGASGYYVYRKASSGDWKKIATVKGSAKKKYLDETPRKGVTYKYYIKAYCDDSKSINSNSYKIKCKY